MLSFNQRCYTEFELFKLCSNYRISCSACCKLHLTGTTTETHVFTFVQKTFERTFSLVRQIVDVLQKQFLLLICVQQSCQFPPTIVPELFASFTPGRVRVPYHVMQKSEEVLLCFFTGVSSSLSLPLSVLVNLNLYLVRRVLSLSLENMRIVNKSSDAMKSSGSDV